MCAKGLRSEHLRERGLAFRLHNSWSVQSCWSYDYKENSKDDNKDNSKYDNKDKSTTKTAIIKIMKTEESAFEGVGDWIQTAQQLVFTILLKL